MRVDCGKCVNCLKNKRNALTARLVAESSTAQLTQFVTLTYDDSQLYYNENNIPSVFMRDVQLFLKKIRKQLDKIDVKLRYFCVSEYGGQFQRPHYHLILYYYIEKCNIRKLEKLRTEFEKIINRSWLKSLIRPHVYDANVATIHYCTKDVMKGYGDTNAPSGADKTFFLFSRRPGLGYFYLKNNLKSIKRLYDSESKNMAKILIQGEEYVLSRYMRTKFKEYFAIDFTINDYYKLLDIESAEYDKHFNECKMNYFNKNPTATLEEFYDNYFKDISDELSRLTKYKSKISHDIKK